MHAAVESVTARFYETFPTLLRSSSASGDGRLPGKTLPIIWSSSGRSSSSGSSSHSRITCTGSPSILASRSVPTSHLPLSLDWLREFFTVHLPGEDAKIVRWTLEAGKSALLEAKGQPIFHVRGMPGAWDVSDEFEALLLPETTRRRTPCSAGIRRER